MNNGRKISESAALLAVFCILILICIQVPFIGAILVFFLPLPFIFVSSKYNLSWSISFLIIGTIISALFGTIMTAPIPLLFGSTGIAIGYNLRKKNSFITLFISSVLVFLAGFIAFYIGSSYFLHFNFIDTAVHTLRDNYQQVSDLFAKMGKPQDPKAVEKFNNYLTMIRILTPSLFVVTSIIMVFLILLVVSPFIKRFSKNNIIWKPFRELQLPRSVLWYYLIVMLISYILKPDQSDTIYMVLVNMLYILQFFLLLQGFSFVFYLCHRRGLPKALPWIIVVGSLIIPILLYAIRILGIIDLGFRQREKINKK